MAMATYQNEHNGDGVEYDGKGDMVVGGDGVVGASGCVGLRDGGGIVLKCRSMNAQCDGWYGHVDCCGCGCDGVCVMAIVWCAARTVIIMMRCWRRCG